MQPGLRLRLRGIGLRPRLHVVTGAEELAAQDGDAPELLLGHVVLASRRHIVPVTIGIMGGDQWHLGCNLCADLPRPHRACALQRALRRGLQRALRHAWHRGPGQVVCRVRGYFACGRWHVAPRCNALRSAPFLSRARTLWPSPSAFLGLPRPLSPSRPFLPSPCCNRRPHGLARCLVRVPKPE